MVAAVTVVVMAGSNLQKQKLLWEEVAAAAAVIAAAVGWSVGRSGRYNGKNVCKLAGRQSSTQVHKQASKQANN